MMLEKAKEECAKLGGNAILLAGIQEASQGSQVAAAVFGLTTNRNGQMIAVRVQYCESSPRPGQQMPETVTEEEQLPSFDEWLAGKDQVGQEAP